MYLPIIGTAFKYAFRRRRQVSPFGNRTDTAGKSKRTNVFSQRVETLVLTSPLDIERAMSAVTLPKRVDIQANLISHSKGTTIEKLLKRVGCLELCIQGKSATAPRRVFEHEVVAAISHVKQNRLQKLILKNVDLQRLEHATAGEQSEGGSLLRNRLEKLKNLKELHVQSCRLDKVLEDVLRSTEKLPHLREVTINLNDALSNQENKAVLMETMTSLLQRTRISSLAMSEFPEDETFWQQVASSQTLTHLGLPYRDDMSDQQTYWDLLQQNSSIDQLELQVKGGTDLKPLMDLLRKNTTITSLLLHLEEDPTHVSQQLTEVMEYQNFTLQKIHLLCHNIYGYKVRIPCPQLDFFAKLNRQGRRHLLGDDCKPKDADWVETIGANIYDVSSTFYWLRSHPNLFSTV